MRSALIVVFIGTALLAGLYAVTAYADTHWVNTGGSNNSPYTSYATGAHQIQDAVDIAVAGDTIRIAAGEYYPDTIIYLQDSLAIIGAGPDSTIILALYGAGPSASRAIMELNRMYGEEGGGLTVQGCSIYGEDNEASKPYGKYGIAIWYQSEAPIIIKDNIFKYCRRAVHIYWAEGNIFENYFENNRDAIALGSYGPFDVYNNIIVGNGDLPSGIKKIIYLSGPTRIHHNTIILPTGKPIFLENDGDSIIINNNLLISKEKEAIFLYCITDGAVVRNNTIIRNGSNDYWDWRTAWFTAAGSSKVLVENNAFWSLESTVGFYEDDYLVPGGGEFEISHNSFWRMDSGGNGALHYDSVVILDTMNDE